MASKVYSLLEPLDLTLGLGSLQCRNSLSLPELNLLLRLLLELILSLFLDPNPFLLLLELILSNQVFLRWKVMLIV
jgi:hypothetical protein